MNEHIATLRNEIDKRDRLIEELERKILVKNEIIRKQVIMLMKATEGGK